mmetsp:Transcript_3010/g.8197  ORF Transcript_3010/g.8197 Transcript_3010/m.8197 type:complete len:125 (+) Transcript_3010:576-950(+)
MTRHNGVGVRVLSNSWLGGGGGGDCVGAKDPRSLLDLNWAKVLTEPQIVEFPGEQHGPNGHHRNIIATAPQTTATGRYPQTETTWQDGVHPLPGTRFLPVHPLGAVTTPSLTAAKSNYPPTYKF